MSARRVKQYLEQGATLTTLKGTDKLILRMSPRKYITLRDDKGALTPSGQAWEAQTGRVLEQGGFLAQVPIRKKNSEFIRLRNGDVVATRK